ncbi:MAG: hypothetical protein TREMPRED_003928 [Tremellales sp. Tagirdzhanova-0007]|nr:MAG: hypothetical protein TREMPRED_003928 [Tremellales sp. Tagirdzhanova-0007]
MSRLIRAKRPHTVEQRSGYVKGVVRRFAQSSLDHRGTLDQPGRVVTVIEASEWYKLVERRKDKNVEDLVWGVAYRIDPGKVDEVKAYLEYREKNGYTSHEVPMYCTSLNGEAEVATIWIGKLDNPAFIGCEPTSDLARIIHQRSGPSGSNKDYLFKLAESVRQLYPNVHDDYLFDLEVNRSLSF